MKGFLFIIYIVFCIIPNVMVQYQPLVHLENGAVQGVYVTSAGGRKFSAFRGIPYSRPPVGKYRFKEPSPIKRWPGVWNATEYGNSCLQYEIDTTERVTGSEDCLFLNIFTPKLFVMESSPLREVLVFIHGKTFMFASELKHDPTHLMDNNIVVVTFNYRTGILGFLSTEDDVAPGNYGLKDQILTLHWIQKNIATFGGNPTKVIIAGSLAGGASVHYHYFSPQSQGLFHGGMSFGGTAFAPWALAYHPRAQANRLSELMGCSKYSSSDLINCLRFRPARQIVKQTKHFLPLSKEFGMIPMSPFGPTIEVMGTTPFISKYPGDSILAGAVQDLPWVISSEAGNGLDPLSVSNSALQQINDNFGSVASVLLGYNNTVRNVVHPQISQNIHHFYINSNNSSSNDSLNGFQQMLKDRMYTVDAERAARLMASIMSSPVYFYVISDDNLKQKLLNLHHDVEMNTGILIPNEIEYIEPTLYSKEFSEEGRSLFKLLTQIFVKFIQTGNPSLTKYGIEWLPLVPNYKELRYLNIFNSSSMEMKSALELGNRKFWDSLPIQDPSSTAYKVKMFSHSTEL